jgi:chromosome segregation ATPase
MNSKVIIIVLAVLAVGLGITLVVIKNQDDQQHAQDVTTSLNLSNSLNSTTADLDAARQVNLALTNDLLQARSQYSDLSNTLAATKGQLEQQTQATATAQAAADADQQKISGLDKRVAELEADNSALDRRAAELTNTIALLNNQIGTIEEQLASTRADKGYLEQQLQQLRDQKADLEHKFNDLVTVRDQYKKLKTEAFVANHIRLRKATEATQGKKLGQLLIEHTPAETGTPTHPAHYDLNVEVGTDGSVHVINPPATTTNSSGH